MRRCYRGSQYHNYNSDNRKRGTRTRTSPKTITNNKNNNTANAEFSKEERRTTPRSWSGVDPVLGHSQLAMANQKYESYKMGNEQEWMAAQPLLKHSYFCTLSIHLIVWFGPKERSKGLIEFASIKLLDLSLRLGRFDLQVHRLFQALLPVVLSSLWSQAPWSPLIIINPTDYRIKSIDHYF